MRFVTAKYRNSIPAAATSLALFAAAIVLINLSLRSGSYDDRTCGSVLESRNQVWELQNSCGVGWFGTFGLVVGVTTVAAKMLALSLLIARGFVPARLAYWLMAAASAGAGCCAIAIAIRSATYPDNPVHRGWVSLRNLTTAVTLGFAVVTLVLRTITSRPTREPTSDEVTNAEMPIGRVPEPVIRSGR